MRYAQKRFYEWSNEMAYCVGLIASDGCLSGDGRHIDLTSVDLEQLENFNLAIGRKLPISVKFSGHSNPAYRIQFSDVALYDFLVTTGLTPAKSHSIKGINVPDEYYFHFLRGLFDGDGTTYGYYDKRWRSSYMYYVQYTSASHTFLEFIQAMNIRMAFVTSGSLRKAGRAYILSYAKTDAIKLAATMYSTPNVIALSRKRQKLEDFIALDESVILTRNARVVKSVNTHA